MKLAWADGLTSTTEMQSGRSDPPRIAFYTHDTFGMGHLRRCLNLIEALAHRRPDAAILLVTGSPALGLVTGQPANVDVVKLPTIAPTGTAANRPPHLPIGMEGLIRMRRETIAKLVETFAPDVFVVDNFALGARRELLPTLDALRSTTTRTVLGLRDIVDDPDVIRRRWAKEGMAAVLRDFYDQLLVFGESDVFDAVRMYGLDPEIAAKTRHCGYVARRGGKDGPGFDELGLPGPRILGMVGGGGDGLPLLQCLLGALERLPDCGALVLSGPLQGEADRDEVLRAAEALGPRVMVRHFVEDPTRLMSEADLVVSMAGYNSVAELLRQNARMLLVPRNWRFGEHARGTAAGVEMEQILRARMLQQAGRAEMLEPSALSPEGLAAAIRNALKRPHRAVGPELRFEGAEVAAEILDRLMRERGRFDAA